MNKITLLELINTVKTTVTNETITENMEILEEVFYHLYEKGKCLNAWGHEITTPNEIRASAEHLGLELKEEPFYLFEYHDAEHGRRRYKVTTDFLKDFCDDLEREILKRDTRITVNHRFNEWDEEGFYYTQAVKVPHALKEELIFYLKNNGHKILDDIETLSNRADTQRRAALIKFIERLEDETTGGATWYALTNTERIFLEWFLCYLINADRIIMKRSLKEKNTALIFV